MFSLGALGIGLSVVFGVFIILLLAELYYLLCWKKKAIASPRTSTTTHDPLSVHYLLCWRRNALADPSLNSISQDPLFSHDPDQTDEETVLTHLDRLPPASFHAELVAKLFPSGGRGEMEVMQLNNLLGPPRLLFTIIEETKEDLDSEDGKNSKILHNPKCSSLPNECILFISSGSVTPQETPFVTPPSSPSSSTPLSPISSPSLLCGLRASASPRFCPSPYLAPMPTLAPALAPRVSQKIPLLVPPPFTPPMSSALSSPFQRTSSPLSFFPRSRAAPSYPSYARGFPP